MIKIGQFKKKPQNRSQAPEHERKKFNKTTGEREREFRNAGEKPKPCPGLTNLDTDTKTVSWLKTCFVC